MIQILAKSVRLPSLILIPMMVTFGACSTRLAQSTSERLPRVLNADWNVVGDHIVITYDLSDAPEGKYDVEVTFLVESNKSFRITPKAVSGDIGNVKGPGIGKTIRWNYRKDMPNMGGEGYYFGFEVYPAKNAFGAVITGIMAIGILVLGVVLATSTRDDG